MTEPTKCTLLHSNLFKQHKTLIPSNKSYYFSQIKNLRSSSTSTKISGKSCRITSSLVKNSHFSGSLFEEAHKINPATQSYLPRSIQPTSNKAKMKALLIHKQKSQSWFKDHRVFKTLSLNKSNWERPQKIVENEAKKEIFQDIVVPMSSLTYLIINQCQVVPEAPNKHVKILNRNQIISSVNDKTQFGSEYLNHRQSSCENPYQLLPLRRSKRRQQNHKK